MGVTYKLKDEVVEYILRQKRDHPQISCRKLVIAVQTAFGLSVSKSSINAVIKEAHLSSPVGRTPADLGRTKKFAIPKEKKVQLFGDEFSVPNKDEIERQGEIQSKPASPAPAQPNTPIQSQISSLSEPASPKSPQAINNDRVTTAETSFPQPSENLTPTDIEEKAILQSDVVESQQHALAETYEITIMRPFFLRMALWEFFSRPVLEEFFKRHTSLGENEIRIVDVLACLAPSALNNPLEALDPENVWLWKLSGWDALPEKDDVEAVVRFITTTKIQKFDYLIELGYFCSLVSLVEFILSDNQRIFLDGRYLMIDSKMAKIFPFCPIERAVEETVRFIDGKDIIMLRCSTQEHLKEVLAIVHGCLSLNHNNPIKKIVFIGTQDDQLLEFDHIPDKSRNFIVCATIAEADFETLFGISLGSISAQMLESKGAHPICFDKFVDLFAVNDGHEKKYSLRMVVFNQQDLGLRDVYLTNIPQSELTARKLETLVADFRQKHPEDDNFDYKPVVLESFLGGDDADFTIGSAIENLNRIVEENMNLMFSQAGKGHKYFTNISGQKGCIIMEDRSIKFQIKSTSGLFEQESNCSSEVLNICRKTTYDGKKISQIL